MSDEITVRAATSWWDRRRFQRLPWTIYAGDRNWVPPILSQERLLLGWGRHPFFDNAEMVTLLAERRGKVVGRVAVFVNNVHNRKYDEKRGFFGFFECVDDVAVARELFDAGRAWLAATRHDGVARAGESVAQLHLRPARSTASTARRRF